MTFSNALQRIKIGRRLRRKGWNGKEQYIEIAHSISYINANNEIVNADNKDMGSRAIAFVGTRGVQLGWLASQEDMLADDWEEIKI